MKEYLGHKFVPLYDRKNIGTGLQSHKCNICGRDVLWAVDDNTWYYWKYVMNIGAISELELSCEEEQVKRLLE